MPRHALLVLPSANRVYRASAPALAVAELRVLGDAVLGGRLRDVGWEQISGVPYLTFTVPDDAPFTPAELAVLGHLSVFYALFTVDAAGPLLRPVAVPPADRLDDDLVTIPKYVGKTNEQFTRLLLTATVASSAAAGRLATGGLAVLDPLCGRGTTLNQALLAGHSAAGVDVDGKHVEAYATYLRTWLERKRLKHRRPSRRSGGPAPPSAAASSPSSGRPSRRSPPATSSASRWSTPTRSAPPTSSAPGRSTSW